jgi:hypothetical protein
MLALHALGVGVAHGAKREIRRHRCQPAFDGSIELLALRAQRLPVGIEHRLVHSAWRQVQQAATQRVGAAALLRSEAGQPELVAPHQVVQRVVDRAEEGAAVALALGVGDLRAGIVQPAVEPAVVAGQETVVVNERVVQGQAFP